MTPTCSPSYSRVWGGRIAWVWEAEVVVSWDRTSALQPGWQSETLSQEKKRNTFSQLVIFIAYCSQIIPSLELFHTIRKGLLSFLYSFPSFLLSLCLPHLLFFRSCCLFYFFNRVSRPVWTSEIHTGLGIETYRGRPQPHHFKPWVIRQQHEPRIAKTTLKRKNKVDE